MAGGEQAIAVEGRAVLRVSTVSGRVKVVAEARPDMLVKHGTTTLDPSDANRVQVDALTGRVEVRVPVGTDVVVGAGSGRVNLDGRFGAVSVAAVSGRVDIDEAEQVDVRVVSGRVEIGRCDGVCRVNSGSGRTQIGSSGPIDVMVESGAIEVAEIRGTARLKTTSGRIEVGLNGAYDVDAESVSGRISILVPPDLRPDVTLKSAGRTRCDCEIGSEPTIRARSVSGRLEVVTTSPGDR